MKVINAIQELDGMQNGKGAFLKVVKNANNTDSIVSVWVEEDIIISLTKHHVQYGKMLQGLGFDYVWEEIHKISDLKICMETTKGEFDIESGIRYMIFFDKNINRYTILIDTSPTFGTWYFSEKVAEDFVERLNKSLIYFGEVC